jgi:tetratricopeptide (TPR) repeat protein
MKIELELPPALSLERKTKMHEAREAIINRLARDLPTNIELERFLNVIVLTAATPKMPEEVPTFTDANEAAAAGDRYLDALETENAINVFRQAVKLNPDFGDAYFKLGIAYSLREKETGGATSQTDEEPTPTPAKISKKGKKDALLPLDAAGKAFESAAKAYEKVLKKSPKDDQALFNLGRAYNKLNKDKEAEKALRQAYKIKPDDAEYAIDFGSILMKLAQYDEAVTVLAKAVKLDDTNLQAQDLLEKAQAGKKRINFGIKPKLPQQQQQPQQEVYVPSKPTKSRPKPSTSTSTIPPPPPLPKPAATQ